MNKPTIAKIFDVAEDYRPMGKPIKTSQSDFDDAMDGGLRGGELITLSGQSGHGKTSWALNLTKDIVDSGVPCLWFTYEMNPWYLKEKFLELGVKDDFNTFVPIEHKENTSEWIKGKILEAKEKHACKIVFIDHLHYLIPPDQEMNMSMVIGGVVRKLKQLAVETDTIIYLIAHMRKLQMGEKVDVNAVRDSALIINESDYVFLIERMKKKEKKKDDLHENPMVNYSQVSLAKNRRTGRVFNKFYKVDNGKFEGVELDEVKEAIKG